MMQGAQIQNLKNVLKYCFKCKQKKNNEITEVLKKKKQPDN